MRIALASDIHGNLAALEAVAVPYDPAPMAALARRNGRLDWDHLLRTGYLPPTGDARR